MFVLPVGHWRNCFGPKTYRLFDTKRGKWNIGRSENNRGFPSKYNALWHRPYYQNKGHMSRSSWSSSLKHVFSSNRQGCTKSTKLHDLTLCEMYIFFKKIYLLDLTWLLNISFDTQGRKWRHLTWHTEIPRQL